MNYPWHFTSPGGTPCTGPEDIWLDTKNDNSAGVCDFRILRRSGLHWFLPTGEEAPAPTHWRRRAEGAFEVGTWMRPDAGKLIRLAQLLMRLESSDGLDPQSITTLQTTARDALGIAH